jgi:hypothetical protein
MFSGRWEESLKRDSDGRVFLDKGSELIKIIVNFLRTKKRDDPSKSTPFPKVREDKKDKFASLLNYYGLSDFFYPPAVFLPLDIGKIEVVQPHDSSVDVTKSENKIQFTKVSGTNYFYF